MRQLNREERALTERTLKKQKVKLSELTETCNYITDVINLNKLQRDHDYKWVLYKRKQKEDQEQSEFKTLSIEIEKTKEIVEVTEKQLKEGDEKKPTKQ